MRKIIIILGALLVLLGLLGFVPNVLIGKDGFFLTNIFHDLVHIISGLVIIFVSLKRINFIGEYLRKIGILYIALAVLGAMTIGMGEGKLLWLFLLNGYDNILHLFIGTVLIIIEGMVLRHNEEKAHEIPQELIDTPSKDDAVNIEEVKETHEH